MSDSSKLQTLTIIQAVLFFAIASACVVATFVEHVTAFLFLGIGIAVCTIVSLIDKATINADNGGFMFVTGDKATWINMGLFIVAMVFMALAMSGVIRIA